MLPYSLLVNRFSWVESGLEVVLEWGSLWLKELRPRSGIQKIKEIQNEPMIYNPEYLGGLY